MTMRLDDAAMSTIPKEPLSARNKIERMAPMDAINYPLFGFLLKQLRQQHPCNWNDPLIPRRKKVSFRLDWHHSL